LANETDEFEKKLQEWLPAIRQWRICWRATEHGWAGSIFHNQCDGKEPSLVIVKVMKDGKNLIFGGYSTQTWAGSKCEFIIIIRQKYKHSITPRHIFQTLFQHEVFLISEISLSLLASY
jgi:hypothetical protein